MRIIIVGGGNVGYYLVKTLMAEKHHIMLIDSSCATSTGQAWCSSCLPMASAPGTLGATGEGCAEGASDVAPATVNLRTPRWGTGADASSARRETRTRRP